MQGTVDSRPTIINIHFLFYFGNHLHYAIGVPIAFGRRSARELPRWSLQGHACVPLSRRG
jgi:hypothetical protein